MPYVYVHGRKKQGLGLTRKKKVGAGFAEEREPVREKKRASKRLGIVGGSQASGCWACCCWVWATSWTWGVLARLAGAGLVFVGLVWTKERKRAQQKKPKIKLTIKRRIKYNK